jgi:surface antigen
MAIISDEILTAYADGELSPTARQTVRQAIAKDPALALKLESFVATGRLNIADAFDGILHEPVPARLLNAVKAGGRRPSRRVGRFAQIGDHIRRWSDLLRVPAWSLATVPALSIGLLIGAIGSWLVQQPDTLVREMGGRLVATGSLQRVLETTPSGTPVIVGQRMVEAESTFYSQRKEWCREYELAVNADNRFKGLACRGQDGGWRVDMHAHARSAAAYAPAGHDVVADAAEKLMQGQPLEPDAEKHLINAGWPAP